MRESRLNKIVNYLLDRGWATAPELAEEFAVSVRTIYRDIDALYGAGIPIYTEAGRNGGIYLADNFALDQEVLFEEDTVEEDTENWLEVDFSGWGNKQGENEKFELLKLAVIHRRSVKIVYAGEDETVSERIIYPLKMAYSQKVWCVKAYCKQEQDYRSFRLTRIIDWELLDESFSGHFIPEEKEIPHQNHNLIKLRFPKEMAYRVYDEFDRSEIRQQANGDFIVLAPMPEDTRLMGFLLSFGTKVDVLAPAQIKYMLAEQARFIYEKHKT